MVEIKEGMEWPPSDELRFKMVEHAAWYSGDANILANYYAQVVATNFLGLPYTVDRDMFWARQIRNDVEIGLHVPIAGDIASTSADLLFAEPPSIKVAQAHEKNASSAFTKTQEEMDKMLDKAGFFMRIIEAAETCAAMGGAYLKMAWDSELSPYPIPVVEQADNAIPYFKFGFLRKVIFWKEIFIDTDRHHYYRLLEYCESDGSIHYELYKGSSDRLGTMIDMSALEETKDLPDVKINGLKQILCVFIPNVMPNRYFRSSYFGRSDYAGIEGLMDSLDETFSSWMKDVLLAQAKVMVPQEFLQKDSGGKFRYNVDQMLYTKLDMDPTVEGNKITPVQFAIRADEFEKTSMALIERIIVSAGYSPQSFGLNIVGRAESGTALNIRERKSFSTKNKKEAYWEQALKYFVQMMLAVYKMELKGKVEADAEITTQFSDSFTNDIGEVSEAVSKIATAMAASTETKVRMLHPDWSEAEVEAEVQMVLEENGLGPMAEPDELGGEKFKIKAKGDGEEAEGEE